MFCRCRGNKCSGVGCLAISQIMVAVTTNICAASGTAALDKDSGKTDGWHAVCPWANHLLPSNGFSLAAREQDSACQQAGLDKVICISQGECRRLNIRAKRRVWVYMGLGKCVLTWANECVWLDWVSCCGRHFKSLFLQAFWEGLMWAVVEGGHSSPRDPNRVNVTLVWQDYMTDF